MLDRELAFGVAAGGGNQLQPERARPLASDQTDAAGRCVEQHEVAGHQAFGRQRLLQQVLRCQALEHHRRAGFERDRVGQLAHALGRHHPGLAVAAGRVAGVSRAVADPQVGHACADRLDNASALHAQVQGQRVGVQAGALVDIDVVQADRVVADTDLAGTGFADGQVDELHHFGSAVLLDLDGLVHGLVLL